MHILSLLGEKSITINSFSTELLRAVYVSDSVLSAGRSSD